MQESTLDRWLEIATRDLCEGAVERVREEVGAHFAAAYDEAIRVGLDDMAATARALLALGNERWARKRFRRTYLTAEELGSLKNLARDAGWIERLGADFNVILLVLGILVVIDFSTTLQDYLQMFLHIGFFTILIGFNSWRALLPGSMRRRYPRLVLAAGMLVLPISTCVLALQVSSMVERAIRHAAWDPVAGILVGAAVAFVAVAGAAGLTYWWAQMWTIFRKLRDKRNREAAGL